MRTHLGNDEIPGANESGQVHKAQGGKQAGPPGGHLIHKGAQQLGAACQHAHRVYDQLQAHIMKQDISQYTHCIIDQPHAGALLMMGTACCHPDWFVLMMGTKRSK